MSFSPACRLSDGQTVWVSASDNAKNGYGRPSSHIAWGISAVSIAASYREAHRSDVRPISWVA